MAGSTRNILDTVEGEGKSTKATLLDMTLDMSNMRLLQEDGETSITPRTPHNSPRADSLRQNSSPRSLKRSPRAVPFEENEMEGVRQHDYVMKRKSSGGLSVMRKKSGDSLSVMRRKSSGNFSSFIKVGAKSADEDTKEKTAAVNNNVPDATFTV